MKSEERHRMTALIVDKDISQCDLGALVFDAFDIAVERVGTAQEAIDHLVDHSGKVMVLLADADLCGGIDGVALARRVAVLWPAMSVILTTSASDAAPSDLPPRAVCLTKPWRPLDIVAAAERASRADHTVRSVRL